MTSKLSLKEGYNKLKKSYNPYLAINVALVGVCLFLSSDLFFEELIWTKWEFLFLLSAVAGIYLLFTKNQSMKIDWFFIGVSLCTLCLLLKAFIECTNYYECWHILVFWLLYLFFYFSQTSKFREYKVFFISSIILTVVGYYQFFSGYKFIVGTYDNPAGYTLSLVCLFPYIYYIRTKTKLLSIKYIINGIILLIITIILLSSSRTALIAFFVMASVFIPFRYKKYVYTTGIILLFVLILFIKTDSSTGRFFILKTSLSMIDLNSILWGHGYGFFKNQYMTFQADFFQNMKNNQYNLIADNIFHPMNEYLLFVIEHGVILSIIFLIVLFFYMKHAERKSPEFLSIIGVLVFSFFSYPFKYPVTYLVLAYGLASLSYQRNITLKINTFHKAILCLSCCLWIVYIFHDIYNNYAWKEYYKKAQLGQFEKVKDKYLKLSSSMLSNVDFLFNYSSVLYNNGYYDMSLSYAQKTYKLLNNYDTQLLLADNYKELNQHQLAIYHYTKASFMCPNRFVPLYGLFNIYKDKKDSIRMDSIGTKILSKKIKIRSATIDNIISNVQKDICMLRNNSSKEKNGHNYKKR